MNLVIMSFLLMKILRLASIARAPHCSLMVSILRSHAVTMCSPFSRAPCHVLSRGFWELSIPGGENFGCRRHSGINVTLFRNGGSGCDLRKVRPESCEGKKDTHIY